MEELTYSVFYSSHVSDLISLISPAAQKFLENSVRNIEGIFNIEQAKSDRIPNPNHLPVITGLGTSQIAASIILAQFPAKNENPSCQAVIYMGRVFISLNYLLKLERSLLALS